MSLQLLTSFKQHIIDAGFDAGYSFKLMRWSDSDIDDEPFIFLRTVGDGASNILLQQIDVLVRLVRGSPNTDPTGTTDGSDRIWQIARLFREDSRQPDVVRFEVLTSPMGPFTFTDDRPFWELNIRAYVENL